MYSSHYMTVAVVSCGTHVNTTLYTLVYPLDTTLHTLVYSLDTTLYTLVYSLDTTLLHTLVYSLNTTLLHTVLHNNVTICVHSCRPSGYSGAVGEAVVLLHISQVSKLGDDCLSLLFSLGNESFYSLPFSQLPAPSFNDTPVCASFMHTVYEQYFK